MANDSSNINRLVSTLRVFSGIPFLAWLAEQFLSNELPNWWSGIPWLEILVLSVVFNLGVLTRDLMDSESPIRKWWSKQSEIASIKYQIERPNEIYNPQTVVATITISKPVQDFACYFRWAKPEYYFNAPPKWIWSRQTALCEGLSVGPGKVINENVVTVERPREGHSRVLFLDDQAGQGDSPFERIYLLEIVATCRGRTHKVRELIKIVQSEKPTLVPPDLPDISDFREE